MHLIDINTGVEYLVSEYQIVKTGKVYERREGYCADEGAAFSECRFKDIDTNRAILLYEPLEKPNPMPEILPGDYVMHPDDGNEYIFANDILSDEFKSGINLICRNGKPIWSKSK